MPSLFGWAGINPPYIGLTVFFVGEGFTPSHHFSWADIKSAPTFCLFTCLIWCGAPAPKAHSPLTEYV